VERIPAQVNELSTDASARYLVMSSPVDVIVRPPSGTRIANSRGVPGTLGCLVHTLHDNQSVLLSTWHVLFGNGTREGDAIWLVGESEAKRTFSQLGSTLLSVVKTST
jgi:hypothetical protein